MTKQITVISVTAIDNPPVPVASRNRVSRVGISGVFGRTTSRPVTRPHIPPAGQRRAEENSGGTGSKKWELLPGSFPTVPALLRQA